MKFYCCLNIINTKKNKKNFFEKNHEKISKNYVDILKNYENNLKLGLFNLIWFLQCTYMILLTKTYFFVNIYLETHDISWYIRRYIQKLNLSRHISGVAPVSQTKKDVFINTIIYVDCKNAIKLSGSRVQKNFIFFWYIRYIGKKISGFFFIIFFFSPLLTDILHIGHF